MSTDDAGVHGVGPVRRLLTVVFSRFWAVPALWCVGAVGLGLALPQVDQGTASWMPLLFAGGVDGARSLLSSVAGAMISVTGLVFSITIVALQLASSQFSPRLLTSFLHSRVTQHTLGVFTATFVYALTVLRSVAGPTSDDGTVEVPQLAVSAAYLLVLGAVAMFLAFIHHITQSMSVGTVLRRAGAATRRLVPAPDAPERPPGRTIDTDLHHPGGQHVVTTSRPGHLDRVDVGPLVGWAAREGVRVEVSHPLGRFLPEGAPLAVVHGVPAGVEEHDAVVRRHLHLTDDRSTQQDLSFGFRQLVDVGERALSPGVNDPTTAAQVVDQLHDVLRRLVALPDPSGEAVDDDGIVSVALPPHRVAGLLDLAVDELAHWGRDSLQLPRRLEDMLVDLAAAARPEHRTTVEAKLSSLRAGSA